MMKKYLITTIILFIVSALFTFDVFAQNKFSEQDCFTDEEIDLNVKSLPKNYNGNDLQKLIKEINRRMNLSKGEFETTEQFRQRVEKENQKYLFTKHSYESYFAFDISETEFRYNADKQRMGAELRLASNTRWSRPCEKRMMGGDILLLIEESFLLDLFNIDTEETKKTGLLFRPLLINSFLLDLSFNIDIEKAKKTKPNLRTLFIVKLDKRNGKYLGYTGLNVKLYEIWIYDASTGEIFVKTNSNDIAKLQKEKEYKKGEISKANSFYKDGQYEESLSELTKVLASEPMNAEAHLLMGKIYFRQGKKEESISNSRTALFWNNELIDAHILLSKIYLMKSDCLQAKNYLDSASKIDKENPEVKDLQNQVEKCRK
ncbi:MAG: tetratricopeptide repeat protein [Aridibacter sp.]